jgi:murein DD-endopeptidase MepM/ murein hydrolase activator NlpD
MFKRAFVLWLVLVSNISFPPPLFSRAYATQYLAGIDLDEGWQTDISLSNLENRRVSLTLKTYSQDGTELGRIADVSALEAGETRTIHAQALPPGSKSLKIESDGDVAGTVTFRASDGRKSEVISAIRESARQLDFPALIPELIGKDSYYKTITMLNPNSAPADIALIALDRSGYEIDRFISTPLSPMESRSITLATTFRSTTLENLSTVRVLSNRKIIGLQLVDHPESDLVGLPALITTSKGWTFPIASKEGNLDLWTTLGILNPGETFASLTVEAFDANNASLGIIDRQSLPPGTTHFITTANIGGVIPANTAALKVFSDQAVSVYGVVAVYGQGLTAVLAIPEEDETMTGFEIVGSRDRSALKTYQERLAAQQSAATAPVITSVTPSSGVASTQSAGSISLVFPVKVSGQNTPWTAPISAVFDHSMERPYGDGSYQGYGKVTAFTGEEGSGTPDPCPPLGLGVLYGYLNPTKDVFIVNGAYTGVRSCGGRSYLQYDNHPGIDYSFEYGTAVYPAIRGRVHYFKPPWPIMRDAQNYHTLQIDPEDGSGYKVYYLHLSTYPDPKDPSGQKILRRVKKPDGTYTTTVCDECAKENEWVDVGRSKPIGYTGDYFKGWGGVSPHLHFEVQRDGIPVDPYGWDVVGMDDPYDTIQKKKGINVLLWRDPRLNAQGGIDQRPIARFRMTASNGQAANENAALNLTVPSGGKIWVRFDPSPSSDPDGSIRTYRWYINGQLQAQSQPQTSSFSSSFGVGTHQIWLVVQDEKGATGLAAASVIVKEAGPPTSVCSYSISPTSQSFGSGGGSGSVSVTTQSGCRWTATSTASWITITSGSSGTGSGTVNYTVAANTSTSARTGTLSISGQNFTQTFTVSQAGSSCSYSISPTSQSFGSGSGSGSVSVTTQSGCRWTATSNASWITITSGSSGTGSGTVNYTVAANTSTSARTGTLSISGQNFTQTFTVSQAGSSCSYSISPTSQSFGSGSGSGSVSVTTQSGCPWTATSTVSWITITSGSSGAGSGTVNYTVAANTSTSARTGTLSISGQNFTQTFTVNQSGASAPINRLLNPGFESGPVNWVQYTSGSGSIITDSTKASGRSGSWYAWFGARDNVTDYIYQDVRIPSNATQANVEFWYQVSTRETSTSQCYDSLVVEVRRPSDNVLLATLTTLCNYHKTNVWTRSGPFSVLNFRGETVRLRFYCRTDAADPTSFFVDDIALTSDGN